MMSWLMRRRRVRIERIDAEAEALIDDLGDQAYAEARRRQGEASSDAIARDWERVALSIARRTADDAGPDGASRTASDADLESGSECDASGRRERHLNRGQLDELARVLDAKPAALRIQFLSSTNSKTVVLKEVETTASHLSEAVITAANTDWPAQTTALRIVDREGREVFARRRFARRNRKDIRLAAS